MSIVGQSYTGRTHGSDATSLPLSTRAMPALARCDPPLLSKTDPGGLWLSLEGLVTLLQMAIPEG